MSKPGESLVPTLKMASTWKSEEAYVRVEKCRVMLVLHGFLSAAENQRVKSRIQEWAARQPRAKK